MVKVLSRSVGVLAASAVLLTLAAAGPAAQVVPAAPSPTPPAPGRPVAVPYDFDGDGLPELVAGAAGLSVGRTSEAGGVVVLPATRTGLTLAEQVLTEATPGLHTRPEADDHFGEALASADFDADGFADLAVAAPQRTVGGRSYAGSVTVVYGSAHGLDAGRSTVISEPGGAGANDRFGFALATGDLTGDGYPDLTVGSPNEGSRSTGDEDPAAGPSGRVTVLAGGADGLGTNAVRVLRRHGPAGGHDDWDNGFGASLATADLDGDGDLDLAVGSGGGNGPDAYYPGSVSVCPGRPGGPTGCTRILHSSAVAGSTSLAAGPVTRRDRPDLVVGVGDATEDGTGSVRILRLRKGPRPALERSISLTQNSRGVPGTNEDTDFFGQDVALADVDHDGYDDLFIGAPGEDRGRGRVTVVHGAAGGWRASGNRTYRQDTPGIPGKAEEDDAFGTSISLLDHDGDGKVDLDVDARGENDSGAVTTLRGSGRGLTTKGARTFGLATLGVTGGDLAGFGDPLGR